MYRSGCQTRSTANSWQANKHIRGQDDWHWCVPESVHDADRRYESCRAAERRGRCRAAVGLAPPSLYEGRGLGCLRAPAQAWQHVAGKGVEKGVLIAADVVDVDLVEAEIDEVLDVRGML